MAYLLYLLSVASVAFWLIIWAMHLCALTNAKLKLNRTPGCSSAAGRRERKLRLLRQKLLAYMSSSASKRRDDPTKWQRRPRTGPKLDNLCTGPGELATGRADAGHTEIAASDQTSGNTPSADRDEQPSGPVNGISWPSPNSTISSPPVAGANVTGSPTRSIGGQLSERLARSDDFAAISLPLPGVSIIKPIIGVDTNLHTNLETFFTMDYPTYELLFCVQETGDAAVALVEALIARYPSVDASLFVGGSRVGVNPKINNMQPAYEAIKYGLVLVSDSGISMRRDTLLDMVNHMHNDVALVHQMPFVCEGRRGFQSVVERVYFGTAHARAYLTADLLNINCPTGMSALMRKRLLDEVGGIKAFGQYLAEDFFFAKSFTDRGWRISISSQPALQNSASSGDALAALNSRIQRWIKLRFAMVPQWTLLEPFSECMLLGLLGAMSISFLWPRIDPLAVFLFHVLLWFLFDYKLLCTIQGGPLPCSKTDFIMAWLVRECTALLVFVKALASPKVTWRSRIFKLKWGGRAEELFSGPAGAAATKERPNN